MGPLILLSCVGPDDAEPLDSSVEDSVADTGERDPIRDLDPATLPAGPSPCRDPQLVRITEVVDGDTAYVEWADQTWQTEKVRFIGIDTPETWEDACWADEAKDYTRAAIEDELVWMTFDRTCEDSYDRALAYLWRSAEDFVNLDIVRQGNGWAFPYEPNTTFEDEFQTAEDLAHAEGLGMWADCY